MTSIVAGVDGGGTKTHVVVATSEGEVLGASVNGPSNWEDVGTEGTTKAIRVALDEALDAAGASTTAIQASVFGLAGLDWPSDLARLEGALAPLGLSGPSRILNDSFIALRAGCTRPWGVVVISGTGSVAAGRNPSGEEWRTLGLGRMFGDFGSALDVSEEAILAVAEAYTGRGPATILTELMCEHAGASSVEELLERVSRPTQLPIVYQADNVAPVVLRATERGDLVSRDILERVGHALGRSGALVIRRLGMEEESFELVLAGGLFRSPNRYLDDSIELEIQRTAQGARITRLKAPPVAGSVLIALELAGLEPSPEVRARLDAEVTSALLADTA